MLRKLLGIIVLLVCALGAPVLLVIINPNDSLFLFLMIILGVFSLLFVSDAIIKNWQE